MEIKKKLTDEECRIKEKYYCSTCGGWIMSRPREEPYNDIGFLSGSAGIYYKCVNCNSIVAQQIRVMS